MLTKGKFQASERKIEYSNEVINIIVVVDSWSWIEYFIGSKHGAVVAKYIEKEDCYIPSIVLVEIAGKYIRENFPESEVRKRIIFITKKSEIVELNIELAIMGGKCWIELRNIAKQKGLSKLPSLADGIILATARYLRGKVLTGDEHFRFLDDDVIFVGKND